MRLILALLAQANTRWAMADLARADFLRTEIDAAMDRASARLITAGELVRRAQRCR